MNHNSSPSLRTCKICKLVKENYAREGEHSGDDGKVNGNGRVNYDMVKQHRVAEKCSVTMMGELMNAGTSKNLVKNL